MIETLIAEKTAAETSKSFEVKYSNTCTIVTNGLAGAEEIELEIECLPDQFVPAYDYIDQGKYTLKATANIICIGAPGWYRVVKPVTASATSVGLHRNN